MSPFFTVTLSRCALAGVVTRDEFRFRLSRVSNRAEVEAGCGGLKGCVMRFARSGVLAVLCGVSAMAGAAAIVDNAALSNEADGHNWAAYGRTFGETHYSPLVEINRETVPRLNLAWSLDLDVTNNLSTPLAVEGVIYVASGYSFVHAIDARTGKLLWRYDPEVAQVAGLKLRTGW